MTPVISCDPQPEHQLVMEANRGEHAITRLFNGFLNSLKPGFNIDALNFPRAQHLLPNDVAKTAAALLARAARLPTFGSANAFIFRASASFAGCDLFDFLVTELRNQVRRNNFCPTSGMPARAIPEKFTAAGARDLPENP